MRWGSVVFLDKFHASVSGAVSAGVVRDYVSCGSHATVCSENGRSRAYCPSHGVSHGPQPNMQFSFVRYDFLVHRGSQVKQPRQGRGARKHSW